VEKTLPDFGLLITQQLKPFAAQVVGNPLAVVLAVTARPLSAAAAEALEKALIALGWGEHSWCGLALGIDEHGTWSEKAALAPMVCPPHKARAGEPTPYCPQLLASGELRLVVEIVDPLAVLALDEDARRALMTAFASEELGLLTEFSAGSSRSVLGRNFVSVDGFEAALSDAQRKQVIWAQLKHCKRPWKDA
jgi:hypothetical protein